MNILLSAYECDPNRGSEFGRSWSWVINYVQRGYNVWCLTSERGKSSIQKYLKKHPIENLHFVFVPVPQWIEQKYQKTQGTIWVYLHYWFWLHRSLQAARSLVDDISFQWAHHVSWGSIQQGTSLWKLPVPLVFGPVGGGQFPPSFLKGYFLEGWSTERKRKWISKLLVLFNPNTKNTLQRAKVTLVVNEDTYKMAQQLSAQRISLFTDIGSNIRTVRQPLQRNDTTMRILWVGRLLYRKGLPLVLKALSLVPKDISFTFTILGDGPVGKYIPDLIKQYALEDRVDWQGQVSFDEVQNAYAQHDVFMFCSLRESLGLQYFEAMSFGLPVITLDLHGAKTAIPDNAAIKIAVSNEDRILKDLAEAVESLYYSPERRVTIGANGANYIKHLLMQDKVEIIEESMKRSS